jgi:hypothetical protein
MKAVIFSLFGKLIKKLRLLMPGKKRHDVLQRGQEPMFDMLIQKSRLMMHVEKRHDVLQRGRESMFGKLLQKLWLLLPGKKKHDVLQRERKSIGIQEYYYIKYAIRAFRVIAWIVLVLGFVGSLVWGITAGGIEGWLLTLVGIIGSFLAWLLLLATRELIYLFIHVEENTSSTTEGITEKSR